jgi:hypothetical protein
MVCLPRCMSELSLTSTAVPFERLNKNDSLLLVLDLQDGLYSL